MATTVTVSADPLYIDVVEDNTDDGVRTVITYTTLKADYLESLTTQKSQTELAIADLNQQISDNNAVLCDCNDQLSATDALIDTVNAL